MALRKFPQKGYSTVHRTLKLLIECGLASERLFSDRYTRLASRHKDQHHDHLICSECGTIIEFESQKIERLHNNVAKQKNFKVTHNSLDFYGICNKCQKTAKL